MTKETSRALVESAFTLSIKILCIYRLTNVTAEYHLWSTRPALLALTALWLSPALSQTIVLPFYL